MTKKKSTSGELTPDKAVYSKIISEFQANGWTIRPIPKTIRDTASDEYIAKTVGKGRCVMLTYDHTAYTHNVKRGFVGYIEYDPPEKEKFDNFILDFRKVSKPLKRKDITGYRLVFKNGKYDKQKLPKIR